MGGNVVATKQLADKILADMDGWDLGWVTTYDNERLPLSALTRARNLTLEYGSAKKRFGTSKFNATELDTDLKIDSAYWTEGMLGDLLVVTSGGKIIDLTTGAQSDIATGLTTGQKYGFMEARKSGTNYLYIFGESQAPRRWTGSGSVTTVTGPTVNCSYCVWHKFRGWAARSSDPNLYMSAAQDPESWNARHSLLVLEPNDGEWRGLVSRRRDLVAFAEGAVYLINGQNPEPPGVDLNVDKTTGQKAGAISRDGIAIDQKTDAIYFMSFDGYVYALEGMHKKPLSQQIKDEFDVMNTAALDKVAMIVHDDLLLVSIPYGSAQTTNNRIFVTHLRRPGLPWVEWTGINAGIFVRRALTKKLYMADAGAAVGTLYLYDSATYADAANADAAVDFDLITAPIHDGRFYSRKRALRYHLQCDVVASGTFDVSSGPNEADPDASGFTDAPSQDVSTAATGPAAGDMADGEDVARNGVVSYPGNLSASAEEARGEWFRVRVRANTTTDFKLRRLRVLEATDPEPVRATQ